MTAPIRPAGQWLNPVERGGEPLGLEPEGPSFKEMLGRALGDAAAVQDRAKDYIAAFLRGEPVELHQVMAASEEASITLELLVEVRNKLAEAYRTVMNTQV